jgi:regulator of sirC expression with transglutaminase-like and TPR domain
LTDSRTILDAIGQMPDSEIDIADAALQLARIDAPEADWQAARAHLSELARDAVALAADVPEGDLSARAGALAGLITGRHHYRGDDETYDDLANANLIHVIARRKGLPVSLGILWLHAAKAAGWAAHGIDFPAHFLIALEGRNSQVALDVFHGGVPLDARHLRGLLKQVQGSKAELRPDMLAPMTTRDVLLRLQNNIKVRHLQGGKLPEALSCAEDMLRIAPHEAFLWRETALMNQRLDRVAAALRCFERFLDLVPTGEAAARAKAAMDELRARLN